MEKAEKNITEKNEQQNVTTKKVSETEDFLKAGEYIWASSDSQRHNFMT